MKEKLKKYLQSIGDEIEGVIVPSLKSAVNRNIKTTKHQNKLISLLENVYIV